MLKTKWEQEECICQTKFINGLSKFAFNFFKIKNVLWYEYMMLIGVIIRHKIQYSKYISAYISLLMEIN